MFVSNLSLGRVWWIDNQCDLFIFPTSPSYNVPPPPSPPATLSFGWSAHPSPFGRNVDDVTVWLLARLPSLCTLYYMMTTSLSLSLLKGDKTGRKDEEKSWLGCGPSDDDVVRHTHKKEEEVAEREGLVLLVGFLFSSIESKISRPVFIFDLTTTFHYSIFFLFSYSLSIWFRSFTFFFFFAFFHLVSASRPIEETTTKTKIIIISRFISL